MTLRSQGPDTPQPVVIQVGADTLFGDLSVPADARGLVLFAHGSGSSRSSPRNRLVAHWLQQGRLGTLLLDLLTEREDEVDRYTREFRFDMPRLARRLVAVSDWVARQRTIGSMRLGYFGASTGAAAALMAAAERPAEISAVVSRGGRPDLAEDSLPQVRAPTLLIVGGNDMQVIELNRQALAQLRCPKRLEIVPGATHLFEEPGALEQVGKLTRDWFVTAFENETRAAGSRPENQPRI